MIAIVRGVNVINHACDPTKFRKPVQPCGFGGGAKIVAVLRGRYLTSTRIDKRFEAHQQQPRASSFQLQDT